MGKHYMPFHRRLKQARLAVHMNQEELALMCRVSQAYIAYMENGQRCPTENMLERINNVLGSDIKLTPGIIIADCAGLTQKELHQMKVYRDFLVSRRRK
jgi:predicted transcriptional regulator